MTRYLVYDVFTDTPFGGNPLAVVLDADDLPEAALQRIAREFNFSKTTFVGRTRHPDADARVRIFTPTAELPFAGHPTIGTAIALSELGRAGSEMVLELGVGPIPVRIEDGRARFTTRVPLAVDIAPPLAALAACIGQPEAAFRSDRHAPLTAGVGLPFVLAEVGNAAAFAAARPMTEAFAHALADDTDRLGLLIYMRDGQQIRARMFAPLGGVPEDPATGSAAAALAAWLGRLDGRSQAFEITQGVEMGRPSRITAEVTVEDGDPVEVAISGRAVKVMEGTLCAP